SIEIVQPAHSPFDRIRCAVFHRLTVGLPSQQGRLLGSIVFGASAFPVFPEERERYTLVGLAHILAASGLQVSLLLGVFAMPLARRHRFTGCMAGAFAIGGYLFLAGESPSILRAALMGGGTLLGLFFRRPLLAYVSLWGSALLLLVWEPPLLQNLGFQFSFLATWALLHTMPRIASRLPFPAFLSQALGSILAVTCWVLPLQLHHFGTVTPFGILANLVAGPLVDGITVLGFASIPLSFVPGLGPLLTRLNGGLITGLDRWVSLLLALPGSHVCFHFPLALLLFSYACLLLFFLLPKERGWLWGPMLLLGTILALSPHPAEAYFLSVGQGDAIAIRTRHDRWILVDAGPSGRFDAGEKIIVPFLRRMGCNRIDLLVLTHPHADHQGGLHASLRAFPVAKAWESGLSDPLSNEPLAEFLLRGIPFERPQPGATVELDGVTLRNLSPREPLSNTRSDANNSSLVLRLETRNWRVLLVGDAERELEEWLLQHPSELRAEVLKVAHHGSRFGSSHAFLKAVRPRLGILSVGPNPFKQPNGETLSRLRSRMRTMRTDEGAIRLSFGERLTAENSRGDRFDLPAHPW
ncbi:MAG: ComEC/Rec2 family competence protein, partial [Bacteroidota bacterium]